MGKFELKKLPKDFRFLFTLKEIKEIESLAGITFNKVINGNIANTEKLDTEGTFQSHFRGFSIHGKIIESIWSFTLHQSGFREELLPQLHEKEIKLLSKKKIKEYLNKVYNSKETDLYKSPQLRAYIYIIKDKFKISWTEIK